MGYYFVRSGKTRASGAAGFVSCFMFPAYCEKLCVDLFWSSCFILCCVSRKRTLLCGQLDCLVLATLWVKKRCKIFYMLSLALITDRIAITISSYEKYFIS